MSCIKYMILCKVLNESAAEVPALLTSKIGMKHSGVQLEAMAAIEGMGRRVAIVLGGDGKGQDFAPLKPALEKHGRAVALIGRDAAAIGMALAAGYSLRVLRQVWAGEAASTEGSAADPARDVSGVEWAVVAAMVAAIVLGGLLPAPVLATTGDDVARLLTASSTAGGMP